MPSWNLGVLTRSCHRGIARASASYGLFYWRIYFWPRGGLKTALLSGRGGVGECWFCQRYYHRNRYTMNDDFSKSLYFLDGKLASDIIRANCAFAYTAAWGCESIRNKLSISVTAPWSTASNHNDSVFY